MSNADSAASSGSNTWYLFPATVMCIGAMMAAVPVFLHNPQLSVLRPAGMVLIAIGAPSIGFIRRLQEGTFTVGHLILAMAFYLLVGALLGVVIYDGAIGPAFGK
jgi:hypothetical protein